MSAIALKRQESGRPAFPPRKSVIQFSLVTTPQTARSILPTVVACAGLLIAAFASVFILNTSMVATAIETADTRAKINDVHMRQETLEDEVMQLSTPANLMQRATEMGLEPASSLSYISVPASQISEHDQQAQVQADGKMNASATHAEN